MQHLPTALRIRTQLLALAFLAAAASLHAQAHRPQDHAHDKSILDGIQQRGLLVLLPMHDDKVQRLRERRHNASADRLAAQDSLNLRAYTQAAAAFRFCHVRVLPLSRLQPTQIPTGTWIRAVFREQEEYVGLDDRDWEWYIMIEAGKEPRTAGLPLQCRVGSMRLRESQILALMAQWDKQLQAAHTQHALKGHTN